MEKFSSEIDGFSVGEKLDIMMAKGGDVFVLAFADDENTSNLLSVCNVKSEKMIRNLLKLSSENEEQTAKVTAWLKRVADGVIKSADEMSRFTPGTHEKNMGSLNDKEREQELDAVREFIFDPKMVGLFLTAMPKSYGTNMHVGVHGSADAISELFYSMFQQDYHKALELSTLLDDINAAFKEKVMKGGDLKRVMKDIITDHLSRDKNL